MFKDSFENLSFEEKLKMLHEEANKKQKRIILVEKGYSRGANVRYL